MSQQIVKLVLDPEPGHPPDHALRDLGEALGEGATMGEPDDDGVVEVSVWADDLDEAVKRVIDAIAAAGADDHFEIAEHP
jgi:hypothetical protein